MKTLRQSVDELEDDPFNVAAMMENNWGQILDERKARWERRHTWHERLPRWRRKCNKTDRYEDEHVGR